MMGKKLSQEEHKRRLALYEQGLNDKEIGKIVGVDSRTIWAWRKKYELATKHANEKPKEVIEVDKTAMYRKMLRARFLD